MSKALLNIAVGSGSQGLGAVAGRKAAGSARYATTPGYGRSASGINIYDTPKDKLPGLHRQMGEGAVGLGAGRGPMYGFPAQGGKVASPSYALARTSPHQTGPAGFGGGGGNALTTAVASAPSVGTSKISGKSSIGFGAVAGGALLGGGAAWAMSGENPGWGTFAMGAVAGAAGGYGLRAGVRGASSFAYNISPQGSWGRAVGLNRGAAAMRAMNTHKEGRKTLFAAGAMLGGGAFGAMFGGEGKSHKRGFNQHRGNSFGR